MWTLRRVLGAIVVAVIAFPLGYAVAGSEVGGTTPQIGDPACPAPADLLANPDMDVSPFTADCPQAEAMKAAFQERAREMSELPTFDLRAQCEADPEMAREVSFCEELLSGGIQ